ncbi:MAG: hypothetical protein VX185_06200 [Pseudomonadota bacterium]|nr:hypothetical protein [Pseudomonadota bacterium]
MLIQLKPIPTEISRYSTQKKEGLSNLTQINSAEAQTPRFNLQHFKDFMIICGHNFLLNAEFGNKLQGSASSRYLVLEHDLSSMSIADCREASNEAADIFKQKYGLNVCGGTQNDTFYITQRETYTNK